MRWSLHKLTYYLIQLKQTDEILYCCGNNVVIYFVSEITTRLQSTDTDGAGSAFPQLVLFCQVVLQLKTNEPSSIGSPMKLHKVSSRSKYCVGLVVSYKRKCDRCCCLGCYIIFLQIKNKRIIRIKNQDTTFGLVTVHIA